jgi:hypothetical protein
MFGAKEVVDLRSTKVLTQISLIYTDPPVLETTAENRKFTLLIGFSRPIDSRALNEIA